MDWTKIILAIVAVIGTVVASGAIIKMRNSRNSRKTTRIHKVNQKNIEAGGDVIGGNKITKK